MQRVFKHEDFLVTINQKTNQERYLTKYHNTGLIHEKTLIKHYRIHLPAFSGPFSGARHHRKKIKKVTTFQNANQAQTLPEPTGGETIPPTSGEAGGSGSSGIPSGIPEDCQERLGVLLESVDVCAAFDRYNRSGDYHVNPQNYVPQFNQTNQTNQSQGGNASEGNTTQGGNASQGGNATQGG